MTELLAVMLFAFLVECGRITNRLDTMIDLLKRRTQ